MYIGTQELIKRSGASARQLDYWIRAGVIETVSDRRPGYGHKRQFDMNIIDRVKLLVQISSLNGIQGMSTEVLKMVYNNYYAGSVDLGDGLILTWG